MRSDIADLLELARDVYGASDECAARLDAQSDRLREPLRVALVGSEGSGKSTLINALIEEDGGRMSPARSTKLVTWFRYGDTPRVRVRLADCVRHLEVQRPREILRDLTLIDTPGTGSPGGAASRRAVSFLLPKGGPAAADVVLYVTSDVRPPDLEVLRAYRAASAGLSRGVSAILVLGRADEAGTGGVESLLAARARAGRLADDPDVRSLVVSTVPVSGLLAQGARTLRDTELSALDSIAALGRAARKRITASVEALSAPGPELDLPRVQRAALLDRLGPFGVRLATVLLAGGTSSDDLRGELTGQSGIDDLRGALEGLRSRADFFKADAALALVADIVRNHPRASGTADVESAIERVRVGAHDLRELLTLAAISRSALPAELRADVTSLLGGRGTSPAHRLNIVEPTAVENLVDRARGEVSRWRALADDDGSDPEVAGIARVVVRSAEGMLDELAG